LAAEPQNAGEARDQLVASRLAPERAAIRMSEIELRDVETCDNTATTDTGDAMGGCPTIRTQTVLSAIFSRPHGSGPSNFGYWTSVGSAII
jgi:hypothetical protein